jgi:alkaline phosphatase D
LNSAVAADSTPLSRIAFGSCANQNLPQPVWQGVNQYRPELFIFLGDTVYADTFSIAEMKHKYQQLAAIEGYQTLISYCPVEAIWDDHDYGKNDAGADYSMKAASQQIFLDFFAEPENSERRNSEGIYASRYYGNSEQRIQLILLDTRYFRSPWKKSGKPRVPYEKDNNPQLTMLGEAQWQWLAAELAKPARLRIIASGIQVINDEHGYETWGNFPLERQRLFKLLADSRAEGVMFLSGDRHFSEISKIDADLGYPLIDFTSSGLTHSWLKGATARNSHKVIGYGDLSFGSLSIDWTMKDPLILMEIRDVKGEVKHKLDLKLSDLYRES